VGQVVHEVLSGNKYLKQVFAFQSRLNYDFILAPRATSVIQECDWLFESDKTSVAIRNKFIVEGKTFADVVQVRRALDN
jgi:hypothetical protein